jgi:hypothetical protein
VSGGVQLKAEWSTIRAWGFSWLGVSGSLQRDSERLPLASALSQGMGPADSSRASHVSLPGGVGKKYLCARADPEVGHVMNRPIIRPPTKERSWIVEV